jgi:hypothetical protein
LRNKHKVTLNTIPMTKARINLGALAKRVHLNKEYVILEKDGIPIVGIMDADEIEDYLELRDPKVQRQIEKNHQDYLAGKSRPATELLAELRGVRKRKAPARKKI